MKRQCFICGVEIRESMGFVLGRDVLLHGKTIRELCENCSWKQALKEDIDETS